MMDRDQSRRTFLKRAVYVAPAVITLTAAPALARVGSGQVHGNNGIGQEKRGFFDGPSPGLVNNPNHPEQDFNDGPYPGRH